MSLDESHTRASAITNMKSLKKDKLTKPQIRRLRDDLAFYKRQLENKTDKRRGAEQMYRDAIKRNEEILIKGRFI